MTDKIKNNNNGFEKGQLKNQMTALSEEVIVMKLDIEDMKNRSIRKTLILKYSPGQLTRNLGQK